ncbi:hypothetical protein KP509_35G030500 [Ceratopteris richardii]|nr:hypothetical protein KP509_35G030500 [Ceratopteris richardii]
MFSKPGNICYMRKLHCRLIETENYCDAHIDNCITCTWTQTSTYLHSETRNTGFISDSRQSIITSLQACAGERNLKRCQQIHADILRIDFLKGDNFLYTLLLGVYARCGSFGKAWEVFNELPVQDAVSWTTLIGGYAEHGYGEKALKCLKRMQAAGVLPDAVTFVCSLKACGSICATEKVQELHTEIEARGLLSFNFFIGSALICTYAKGGLLYEAQKVFDKFEVHDAVLWNVLISGYIEKGRNRAALDIFQQMLMQDVLPSEVTFVHALKACSNLQAKYKGQEIHVELVRRGLLERHVLVGSALLDMYMKCDSPIQAGETFDELVLKDSVSWNIMISGYAEHGYDIKSLECFYNMRSESLYPDTVTYASILKSCGNLQAIGQGHVIHVDIIKNGLIDENIIIANSLIDMYMNVSCLSKARQVFNDLHVRDVVTWNILITGYFDHGCYEQALDCYKIMQKDDVCPDILTLICCLKVCANLEAFNKGQEFHSELERLGVVTKDVSVASALIDMYGKCGFLAKAEEVFNSYPHRDAAMWNALIIGYTERGHSDVALARFDQMQLAGCSPSHVTIIGVLKACGKTGAVHRGQTMHTDIIVKGLFEKDLIIGNTLIDMYAKVGSLTMAQQVFDQLPLGIKSISSWNALISGYALVGEADGAFTLFDKMLWEGIRPDPITFHILLSACNRFSLFEKCHDYIEAQREEFGIVSTRQHHMSLFNGLSQVGELDRAFGILKNMQFRLNVVLLQQVLGACKNWGNVEVGKQAFEEIFLIK